MRHSNVCPLVLTLGMVLCISLVAMAEEPQEAEKAALQVVGIGDRQSELFTPTGFVIASFLMPVDSDGSTKKSATVTRLFDANNQNVIGFSWIPRSTNVAQLTRQKIVEKCGKPDGISSNYISYGRVFLSFGKDERLAEVTVHISRDTISTKKD